jgi:hypothetical protein
MGVWALSTLVITCSSVRETRNLTPNPPSGKSALVDALRIGRARERKMAEQELRKRLAPSHAIAA